MAKTERSSEILRILETDQALSIQDLSERLDVSPMTVRRDLAELAAQDKVKVLYGSVMLNPPGSPRSADGPYSLIAAGSERPEEKRRIGELAASLVESEDSLIIDNGSTTECLARSLPEDIPYTVLCCSLNVIAECARRRNCKSIISGGLFHENTLMFESVEGLQMIRNFRATKAFVSASGVDVRFGVTCSNSYERETKKAMIASSMRKILVVDSSKFGLLRSDYFAELAEFDEIVTDSGISPEYVRIIEELGIVLRIA
jgi:DeoR family deoxyribose operon repressor